MTIKRKHLVALSAVLLGAFVALCIYTFYYGKAYAYLQDDPKACINCHVMKDSFDGWRVSSHRNVTCNECHTPEPLAAKYATKLEHGVRHSYIFTFENKQIFRLKESGEDIVTQNCIRCHESMVNSILPEHREENRCMDCHQGIAHGRLANRRR